MFRRSRHILRFGLRRSFTSSDDVKWREAFAKKPLWERVPEELKVIASGMVLVFGGLKAFAYMTKEANEVAKELVDTSELLRDMFATGIKQSEIPHGKAWVMSNKHTFVSREGLETMIKDFVNSPASDTYMIIYGNKGVGKSCCVEHALTNMQGVAMVRLTNQSDKTAILNNLTHAVMGKSTSEKFDQNAVKAALQTVSLPKLKETTPTGDTSTSASASDGRETSPSGNTKHVAPETRSAVIVFEIERGDDNDKCIASVRSLAKDLCEVARIIIVLSEANAVLAFGRDPTREVFVRVDDLTKNEAETYLFQREKGKKLSREEKDKLYDNLGTSPGILNSFCDSNMSVDELVAHYLIQADRDLVAFPLKPILQALKEHPEGVKPHFFKNAKYEGVDMSDDRAVGVVMKKHRNPILFDIDKGVYVPLSRAHEVALKSYVVPVVTAPAAQK